VGTGLGTAERLAVDDLNPPGRESSFVGEA
jgi:hypothetical protein